MIRVLCDGIHADLWESLRLLFEVRLGYELYGLHGMEWYDEGLWRFERERLGDAVARQFLAPWDIDAEAPGFWLRPDATHPGQYQKRVTYEQARDLKPDIVLSTLMANDVGLATFARSIGAKFGVHTGNQGQACLWGAADFALLSSTTPELGPGGPPIPHVYYRQEFDTEKDFRPGDRPIPGTVRTMVQCARVSEGYDLFKETAGLLPLASFRWYGHCGDADEFYGGNSENTPTVAQRMRETQIAWHWKRWSDGYGHVIHNWFAIGRPVLVTAQYYRGKLAGELLVPGNHVDITDLSAAQISTVIDNLQHDEEMYWKMAEAAHARFREVVSWEEDAADIKQMIEAIL